MRCRCCRWPTSVWRRDLTSGRCETCLSIARATPGIEQHVAVWYARQAHAAAMLNRKASPDAVGRELLAAGMDAGAVARMVADLVVRQAPYDRAEEMLD